MKKLLLALLITFTVHVRIPFGVDKTYHRVRRVTANQAGFYILDLDSDKQVYVPISWTVVEED